jgi:hypothetical protein
MNSIKESDNFDVYQRVIRAQDFGAYLDVLTVTALLLAFVTKHWPQIPEL